MNLSTSPKNRLIFALEVPNREEAEKYVRLLGDAVGCFKIGLELFIKEGPDVFKIVKENSSASIFLDLKLHLHLNILDLKLYLNLNFLDLKLK